jgi:hypothetical protein
MGGRTSRSQPRAIDLPCARTYQQPDVGRSRRGRSAEREWDRAGDLGRTRFRREGRRPPMHCSGGDFGHARSPAFARAPTSQIAIKWQAASPAASAAWARPRAEALGPPWDRRRDPLRLTMAYGQAVCPLRGNVGMRRVRTPPDLSHVHAGWAGLRRGTRQATSQPQVPGMRPLSMAGHRRLSGSLWGVPKRVV